MANFNYNAQDRVLKLEVTCDEGDDTGEVTAVEYFRTGQDYEADASAVSLAYSGGAAAAEVVVVAGEVFPPASHIALELTFQA
jgi:hypothetical protein